jgi:S-adenosylmethionine:tRNA ribosyltransferase-isomerase
MKAARLPIQRPLQAKLLYVDRRGRIRHRARRDWTGLLRAGDLVIANDAATLPASLAGLHLTTGRPIEIRLAGRPSLREDEITRFSAVVFGKGDFHTPTEHRPPPPLLAPGDELALGPLRATVARVLDHPRLVDIAFAGTSDEIREGIARHGRPIQYAHVPDPLALWDVWTPIAGPPVAFEPPSAGFVLDWSAIRSLRQRGAGFATITHAAGISSTGNPDLDALLPFDEPYRIPQSTAEAIATAKGRIVAIGTTVVRALEYSGGRAGEGLAAGRIGPGTRLRVVDAILSGTHERGTSHYELLRAFTADAVLEHADRELNAHGYRTHEFGDSVWIERLWGGPSAGAGLHQSRHSLRPRLAAAQLVFA